MRFQRVFNAFPVPLPTIGIQSPAAAANFLLRCLVMLLSDATASCYLLLMLLLLVTAAPPRIRSHENSRGVSNVQQPVFL